MQKEAHYWCDKHKKHVNGQAVCQGRGWNNCEYFRGYSPLTRKLLCHYDIRPDLKNNTIISKE